MMNVKSLLVAGVVLIGMNVSAKPNSFPLTCRNYGSHEINVEVTDDSLKNESVSVTIDFGNGQKSPTYNNKEYKSGQFVSELKSGSVSRVLVLNRSKANFGIITRAGLLSIQKNSDGNGYDLNFAINDSVYKAECN